MDIQVDYDAVRKYRKNVTPVIGHIRISVRKSPMRNKSLGPSVALHPRPEPAPPFLQGPMTAASDKLEHSNKVVNNMTVQ